MDLSVNIAGIRMKNPVMVASGTFGYGKEYSNLIDLDKLGAIVTKTITLKPKPGNPPPRIVETSSGILNSIGLQNVGLKVFIKEKLTWLRKKTKTPIIVSIAGESQAEFTSLAKMLDKAKGIAGLEVNISCPNVKKTGVYSSLIGQDPDATYALVKKIRSSTELPLIVKLSPNVTDITQVAKKAAKAGADVLSLINTFIGMAISVETRRPKLARIAGGLSGPAIKPIALRMVYEVAGSVKIPIIGIGGIATAEDAIEFIIAGASCVSIGTGNFVDPQTPIKVIEGIKKYMFKYKIKDIKNLVGSLKM
ncbi:dihydroorotate dehydrogenase [bacterium]|nr:dihydroorotate dehydrogenase [bacterium]